MQIDTRVKIGFDEYNFKRLSDLETDLQNQFSDLKNLADQTIGPGKLDNVKKLVESPADYLVNRYQALWLADRPPHLDFSMIFENETRVKIMLLDEIRNRFQKAFVAMGKYAPTIDAKGIHFNLKENLFNIYLDPVKESHYKALQVVLDSLNALKEFQRLDGYFHIARAVNSLQMSNTGLEININHFKK
jgi:hypothetical protein